MIEEIGDVTSIEEVMISEEPKDLGLEDLVFLVNSQRVEKLEKQLRDEFAKVQARNGEIRYLHSLIQAINTATDSKGNLDISNSPELQQMIIDAKEIYGVDLPVDKKKFTGMERDRLVENIRMKCDDLNVQNDLQLQTIQRLNNERQESFQLAKSMMKTLHELKVRSAQSFSR